MRSLELVAGVGPARKPHPTGQAQRYDRSDTQAAGERNRTSRRLGEICDHRQTDAGAFSRSAGREKGFESPGSNLWTHSVPGVGNREHCAGQRIRGDHSAADCERELATFRHRTRPIDDNVQDRVVERLHDAICIRDVLGYRHADLHAGAGGELDSIPQSHQSFCNLEAKRRATISIACIDESATKPDGPLD